MTQPAAPAPTLLLVDDEEHILSALRRSLRREGYRILAADDPEEALRILAAEPVDLVVSDHKMPVMNGLELLARVAELRPETIRFLITGWTEEVPRGEIDAIGIRELIPKPWDDTKLRSLLRECLQGGAPATGVAGSSSG